MMMASMAEKRVCLSAGATIFAVVFAAIPASADEGGVSFWLPGQFGSLAAAPAVPGWQFGAVYYHTSVSAGGNVAASRQVTIGKLNPTANVNLNANLNGRADLEFLNANYVFATPVFGGQFAFGLTGAFGRFNASIDGTLTNVIGGVTTTRQGSISDARGGIADLYPMASLRWNQGVNNYMVYLTGDIPVGTYDSARLANIGIGHGAIDSGVGYTYFNPKTGYEFSVVTGLTYNFRNNDTGYRNGIDWHVDWGASKFVTKELFIGAVGYFYNQLTADSGALAILGDNRSRIAGIGPQIGYLFPIGGMQGLLSLKGYKEFAAQNRPQGWNTWLTFAVTQAPPRAR
jgi:hypothetical protein